MSKNKRGLPMGKVQNEEVKGKMGGNTNDKNLVYYFSRIL